MINNFFLSVIKIRNLFAKFLSVNNLEKIHFSLQTNFRNIQIDYMIY